MVSVQTHQGELISSGVSLADVPANHDLSLFFLVLARDREHVAEKIEELKGLRVPFTVVCGEKLDQPEVKFREPRGKYDAINYGLKLVPENVQVVAFNDVDTKIHNVDKALESVDFHEVGLAFAKVTVKRGPQKHFYRLLDSIRRRLPINASGELMLVKRELLDKILPMKPCKAEDSYILFKTLELGRKVAFIEKCSVETKRTETLSQETDYKRRTVAGIYQALSSTRPPLAIRIFYMILPLVCPLLLLSGKKGLSWTKGILFGLSDYLHGDRSGLWKPT